MNSSSGDHMLFIAILFFSYFIGMPIIWNCSNYKIHKIELNYRIIEHIFYVMYHIPYTMQYSSKYQMKKIYIIFN